MKWLSNFEGTTSIVGLLYPIKLDSFFEEILYTQLYRAQKIIQ